MAPKFEVVQDDPPETAGKRDDVGANLLLLGLQTVGKRFVAALADLFCLVTVASVFVVWYSVPDPNTLQVVSHTIYGLFVLSINWIVRKS